jgi:hypothetical protein
MQYYFYTGNKKRILRILESQGGMNIPTRAIRWNITHIQTIKFLQVRF